MSRHRRHRHPALAVPNLKGTPGSQWRKRARHIGLVALGAWKLVLGVVTFKAMEVALHTPHYETVGFAGLVAIATVFPSVILLWLGEE